MTLQVAQLGAGLWRWAVAHPDWKPEFDRPDGWGRMVASVYAEFGDAVVLIDPLVSSEPTEAARFWRNLDRDVARLGTGLWNRVLIDATRSWKLERRAEWGGERFPPTVRPAAEDEAKVRARWEELGLRDL